jgi:hypothetical protein
MRLASVASIALLVGIGGIAFAGCASSLGASGALPPVALADGTVPLRVASDQAPGPAVPEARAPGMLRVVSDDPGLPPAPSMSPMGDGMPVVGVPTSDGIPAPVPQPAPPPAAGMGDCYWPAPAAQRCDEPPAPPSEELAAESDVVEEQPLKEIPAPMPAPAAQAPALSRSGCGTPPCQSCCDPCDERGYLGLSLSVLPGLGGGIEYGMHTSVTDCAVWSLEVGMHYQDFTEGLTNEKANGSLTMATLGVRIRLQPRARGHWMLRGGLAWAHAEGNPIDVDTASLDYRGDYIGIYAGAGYEWDLGCHWSTGPEARIYGGYVFDKLRDRDPAIGANPSRDEFGFFGMFLWHLDYRF